MGQVGHLTLAAPRPWVKRTAVKWIATGRMSHSKEALRQAQRERHRERLSGNRALLSGHHRAREWRIITEKLSGTHTFTSLHCLISIPQGRHLKHTALIHTPLSFSLSKLSALVRFTSPTFPHALAFFHPFGTSSLFLSRYRLRQVVFLFLLMFGRVQHSPSEGGQLHFSQNLTCLTLSFKRDGRDVNVLTSLHHQSPRLTSEKLIRALLCQPQSITSSKGASYPSNQETASSAPQGREGKLKHSLIKSWTEYPSLQMASESGMTSCTMRWSSALALACTRTHR